MLTRMADGVGWKEESLLIGGGGEGETWAGMGGSATRQERRLLVHNKRRTVAQESGNSCL
jgi:hypothetical protein